MDWTKIEEEFDSSLVKTRRGAFGTVSYVGMTAYIRRLNQVFEYQWSFDITDAQMSEGFVVVQGKLMAQGVSKMQYGTSRITVSTRSGEVTQIGDDYKAAVSDCLKKCASLFGIGLHLHDDKPEEQSSELLESIDKGEIMITELTGGDREDLRAALWKHETAIEEATSVELNEYYKMLLEKHATVVQSQKEGNVDGQDA